MGSYILCFFFVGSMIPFPSGKFKYVDDYFITDAVCFTGKCMLVSGSIVYFGLSFIAIHYHLYRMWSSCLGSS